MIEQKPAVAPATIEWMRSYIEHELAQTEDDPHARRERLTRKMTTARDDLLTAFARITSENRDTPTNNEGWSVYDVAAHIAGAESGMLHLVNRARDGQTSIAPDFDIEFYNRRGIEKRRDKSLDNLRAILAESREKAMAQIAALRDDEFLTPADHPTIGPTSIYGVFTAIYLHERQHTRDISDALDSASVTPQPTA